MKPVINVKKYGNTCTIYLDDMINETAISIPSFDAAPEDAFPQTLSVGDLLERYGHKYDFNFLERATPELPNTKRARATPEMLESIKKTGQIDTAPSVPPHPAQPQSTPVLSSIEPSPILRSIELMIVKLSVAEGRKLKDLQIEYAAVKKFIVRLYPSLAESIERMEIEHE